MMKLPWRTGRTRAAWWLTAAMVGLAATGFVAAAPTIAAAAQEGDHDAPPRGGPSSQEFGDQADVPSRPASEQPLEASEEKLNLYQLIWDTKWFMLPIGAFSLIVVAVTVERAIGMRSSRVMPPELMRQLGEMQHGNGFDPRNAYRYCQEYPSAAASVIKAMLTRVGRPQSEVERAASEACQREADRMNANVRWLRLSAAVTPLLGLYGTVWGMIQSFYDTTRMLPGQNKADFLAAGIYLALVTTLGGLAVAIPAVILAHYFEGRIERIFQRIEEMVFHLAPQLERFEGRVRFGAAAGEPPIEPPPTPHSGGPPAAATSTRK